MISTIYDGENQIAKYDDVGNLLVSYFQGPGIDNPILMRQAAAGGDMPYYYHTDALGSVMELTDSSGNVVNSYRYDAFGSIVQQSGTVQNPFTYTGREIDPETGLYYYRARYYDAEVGRFMGRDQAMLLNLYVYPFNNPTNFTDPSGNLALFATLPYFCLLCTACAGGWVIGCYYECIHLNQGWDCIESCLDDMKDYLDPRDPIGCPHEGICKATCLTCGVWLFDKIKPVLP